MMFYRLKRWWDMNGWGFIFFGSLILLFILWFFFTRHRDTGSSSTSWEDALQMIFRPSSEPNSRSRRQPSPRAAAEPQHSSRGEKACREFLEFATGKKFIKVRPSWLKNPVTQHPLELDLYNADLRLAVEYNGSQHYNYNSMMHPTKDSFHNQRYRDLIKKQLCDQHGIRLIEVPYTVPPERIPEFLYEKLKNLEVL